MSISVFYSLEDRYLNQAHCYHADDGKCFLYPVDTCLGRSFYPNPGWVRWYWIYVASHHYGDVIMSVIASLITSLTIVYTSVYSGAGQRKHQSSASLAFVWGIHRDRWIPRTKGQLRGKCFHLMTSSHDISKPCHMIHPSCLSVSYSTKTWKTWRTWRAIKHMNDKNRTFCLTGNVFSPEWLKDVSFQVTCVKLLRTE